MLDKFNKSNTYYIYSTCIQLYMLPRMDYVPKFQEKLTITLSNAVIITYGVPVSSLVMKECLR